MRIANNHVAGRAACTALGLWLLIGIEIDRAEGHGVPLLVTVDPTCQQLRVSQSETGQFVFDGGELASTSPGVGVTFPAGGPAAGTALGLETLGGLLYYDHQIAPTDATVVIEGPVIDVFGTPIESDVAEYVVDAQSPAQTGMTWGVYDGRNFWDADGYFTLDSAAAGIYGVPVRLTGDPYLPSDPFLIPWVYDPGDAFSTAVEDAGVSALREFVATQYAADDGGDFDFDGDRDGRDFLLWQRVGDPPGLCRWQGRYGEPVGSVSTTVAIPEPSQMTLAVCLLMLMLAAIRRGF